MFEIREFIQGDEAEIYQLFYETVHYVNARDYSEAQLDAWAPKRSNLEEWRESLQNNYSYVAVDKATRLIIGFSDLEKDGCLNRGYVHKDWQRKGVGTALLKIREEKAKEISLDT